MAADSALTCTATGDLLELAPAGVWTAAQSASLEERVTAAAPQISAARKLTINMAGVCELDTLGAWLLERVIRDCARRKVDVKFVSLPERFRGLFDQIGRVNRLAVPPPANKNKVVACLSRSANGRWRSAPNSRPSWRCWRR